MVQIERCENGFLVKSGNKIWVEKNIHLLLSIIKEALGEDDPGPEKPKILPLKK